MLISRSPSPTANGAKLTGAAGSARHPSAAGPKDRSTRSSIPLAEHPPDGTVGGTARFQYRIVQRVPGKSSLRTIRYRGSYACDVREGARQAGHVLALLRAPGRTVSVRVALP